MITAQVEVAVRNLLQDRGLKQLPNENLGDFVARGLGITAKQANAFLAAINDGNTIEEAQSMAGIESGLPQGGLLVEIGRAIGAAIGKITAKS